MKRDVSRQTRTLDRALLGAFFVLSAVSLMLFVASSSAASTASAAASATYYVSPTGSDAANGSESTPFATLGQAAKVARSGSTILLESGTYHESVQVYRKALTIQAAPGATVVFDGAREVTNWFEEGGQWWTSWNTVGDRVGPPWVLADNLVAGYPEMVYIDGQALRQVATRGEMAAGTFYHDTGAGRFWIADNPAGKFVEAAALEWGIYLNEADGSVLRDVTVRRYATPKKLMAAIRAYGNDVLVENVTAELNAFAGISAIGDDIVLRDVTAQDNGQNGLHGHFANNLLVDRARVLRNNTERFDPFWASGGIKVTTSPGFVFQNSYVAENFGPGVWTDLEVRDGAIINNLFERNTRSAIEIELSAFMVLANNVAIDNGEAGAYVLESSDVDVWNNAFYGNFREIRVFEGNRPVPGNRDPRVEWEVRRVTVYNNAIGPSADGKESVLVGIDGSLPNKPTGNVMGVLSDNNVYWNEQDGSDLTLWMGPDETFPRPSPNLVQHRNQSGQDATSEEIVSDSNPLAADPVANDFRSIAAPVGAPIPERVARYLGVDANSTPTVGPVTVSDPLGPLASVDVVRAQPPTVRPQNSTPASVDVAVPNATVPTLSAPSAGNLPFITTTPFRLLDTRPEFATSDGIASDNGTVAANGVVEVRVAGRGPVPADAAGVIVNVTAVSGPAPGFVTLYPCSSPRPTTSSLNYVGSSVQGNSAVVQVGTAGKVCAYTPAAADIIIDTTGYVPASSFLATFSPVRLLDTRETSGPLAGGRVLELQLAGANGIPADATGAVLNVTTVAPPAGGFITIFKCGDPQPEAASINYAAGDILAGLLIAQVGDDGKTCIFASSETDIVIDMSGYLFPTPSVRLEAPARILDTRVDGATIDNQYARIGPRGDGFILSLDVAGRAGVPSDASTVFLNVIALDTEGPGFVTVFPCGSERPETSTGNYDGGDIVNAFAVSAIGTNGQVCVYTLRGANLIVDVNGAI